MLRWFFALRYAARPLVLHQAAFFDLWIVGRGWISCGARGQPKAAQTRSSRSCTASSRTSSAPASCPPTPWARAGGARGFGGQRADDQPHAGAGLLDLPGVLAHPGAPARVVRPGGGGPDHPDGALAVLGRPLRAPLKQALGPALRGRPAPKRSPRSARQGTVCQQRAQSPSQARAWGTGASRAPGCARRRRGGAASGPASRGGGARRRPPKRIKVRIE
jgi:hypothetical protein